MFCCFVYTKTHEGRTKDGRERERERPIYVFVRLELEYEQTLPTVRSIQLNCIPELSELRKKKKKIKDHN